MEAKKNSLMQEFSKHARKIAMGGLLAASAMGLGGCMVTTGGGYVSSPYAAGGQYVNPTYGHNVGQGTQRSQYAITYTPPRAPWANDPSFRQEVSLNLQQANGNVQRYYANYQSRLAQCSARFATSASRNSDYINRQRNSRDGMDWMDYMNSGARINATNAAYNQCRVTAQTSFQSQYLNQQKSFNSKVDALNKKYARQYGVRW